MGIYIRPWLLLAVLFVITCLIASQKVDKGISEPEDQEDSGSGEVPSTCRNDTCSGNGQCTVEASVAVCECDYGVSGRWCNGISQRSYATYCSPYPCQNGENGGTCKAYRNGFVCDTGRSECYACRPGDICQMIGGVAMCQPYNNNLCVPNPCLNGGTCAVPKGNGFFCRCRAGLSGERCETPDTIGCKPATCGVHGNCVLSKCRCQPGWKGELCDVAPCIPNPCNHGTCTTVNESFECGCSPGYNGRLCSHRSNDRCNPNPCANGRICTPSMAGYDCTCSLGYSGVNCRTLSPLGFCNPSPCVDGGICTPSTTGYSCTCYRGYSGGDCNIAPPLGSCNPNPCVNGGTCTPSTASYSCTCHHGYSGVNCRTAPPPLGSCKTRPCRNGGSCIPVGRESAYTCACLPGTTGRLCQGIVVRSQVSPCNPNPCHGGCKCVPSCRHANGYYCSGTNGLLGRNCRIPAPVIVCGENAISISIDDEVVNEYDPGVGQFTMFMAMSHSMIPNPRCPAQNQGNSYSLVLPLPFNNCGTEVKSNAEGKTMVSNYIWLNRLIANGVADMPVPILHFTCEYEKQYRVITSLNPGVDIPPTIVSYGERTDSAVIDLCKSGKFCPSQCPEMYSLSQGATYTVGEKLFLRITPTRVGTQFRISDLFLSCSSDPATTYASSPIVLLANGCFATGSGKYLPTNVQPVAAGVCASFPVPLLKNCARFYIHAKLQSCSPGVCVSAYTPCSGRLRRSDQTSEERDENPGIQVFGPIVVIEGKAGVSTKVMYPDEEYVNSTNTGVLVLKDEALSTIPGSSALSLYVTLGVLLVVAVAVFGLLVGHNWHYIDAHCGREV